MVGPWSKESGTTTHFPDEDEGHLNVPQEVLDSCDSTHDWRDVAAGDDRSTSSVISIKRRRRCRSRKETMEALRKAGSILNFGRAAAATKLLEVLGVKSLGESLGLVGSVVDSVKKTEDE